MPRPGQAHVVITQESIAAVNSLVRENRRITTRKIADSLSVSKGTIDTILHEHLQYSKVCAQWIPKHLRTRSVCEWVFASSIYCVTAQRETTFSPGLQLATKPGATTMRSEKPLKNGSTRNPRLPSLTVSIVSWTNGTLVSTNKETMCRQYVLHRYCLCTTIQFIIYTCI